MANPNPRTSWLARHWPWLVGGGCLVLLAVAALFIGGILLAVSAAMKSSDAYQQAMEAARLHPEVIAALGEPIEPGLLPGGSIEVIGPTGTADLSIGISGPDGSGTIFVSARKTAGIWQFEVLEVAIDGRQDRIPLTPPR